MKRSWLALPALVALLACEPARPTIGAGSNPQSGTVHVSRDGSHVFVLSQDHAAVLVIDRVTKETVRQIPVGEGPAAMALLPNGNLAVANRTSGSVSIVNPDTGVELNQFFVGVEPSAVAARGDKLLVTLSADARLLEVDPSNGAISRTINLGRRAPEGIAVLESGLVYVSHFYGDRAEGGRISVVDVDLGNVIQSIRVSMPSNPLLQANQLASLTVAPKGDEVSAPHEETNNDPGGFNTGTPPPSQPYYAAGPSGMPAVVPAVTTLDPRGHINTSDADPANPATCISCGTGSAGTTPVSERKAGETYSAPAVHNTLDEAIWGKAGLVNNPVAVAYVDGGKGKLVLYRGSANVMLLRTKSLGEQDPVVAQYPVGEGANGIAVSPDGKSAYVYSQFDYTLHELPLSPVDVPQETSAGLMQPTKVSQAPVRGGGEITRIPSVTRAAASRPSSITAAMDNGRRIFFGATRPELTRKGAVSCASCHPNGRSDGMNWTFGTAKMRNTPQLGGRISDTAPFHWEENDRPNKSSMNITVTAFMGGSGISEREIDDLFTFIDTIPKAQSPLAHQPEAQAAIARGSDIFFSATSKCITCHTGAQFTDNKVWSPSLTGTGDKEPYVNFNTPVLAGLSASAPYFHDGRADAATLEQLVTNYVRTDKMGVGSNLTDAQASDLVAFLKSL